MDVAPKPRLQQAMTLIEIIVAVGIISLLAVLLVPTVNRMIEKTRTIQCLSNLRGVGNVLLTAITEQPGGPIFRPWYSGNKGTFWNTWLVANGYLSRAELKKLSCPSIPYPTNISGKHYGISMTDPNHNIIYTDENGNKVNGYQINIRTQDRPTSTIFMADSATAAGEQSIRIFRSDSGAFSSGAIHARHHEAANLFFLDGHAETAGADRMYELGIRRVLRKTKNQNFEPYTLPAPGQ